MKLSETEIISEIEKIKVRNKKVEMDKRWETSLTRKISIACLTYLVVVLFFYINNLPKPFINAIIPTLGFLISTLTLVTIKNIWIKSNSP